MLTLKLQRLGKKKQAHFRLIIQEKSANPQSNSLEILGWYNPRSKNKEFKADRIKYWLDKGAESTSTVKNLLIDAGLIKEDKVKSMKISKKRAEKIATDKKAKEDKIAAEVAAKAAAEKQAEETKTESPTEEKPAEEAKEEIKAE